MFHNHVNKFSLCLCQVRSALMYKLYTVAKLIVSMINTMVNFSGFSVGFCINEEEDYLLPTRWENSLPMYRLNASVVIRAKVKEVRTNITIYSHTLLRIHIIGGQRSVRIAPPSLPPHHTDPAARDFQSSMSVEALL